MTPRVWHLPIMLEVFGLSDIGCVRQNNEDFYSLSPDLHLYVVSDGMGGAQAGEVAAQLAVDTVLAHMRQSGSKDASMLVAAFEAAHNCVAAAAARPDRKGMGCTLVAALIEGASLFLANVGDSRAYVFENGRCIHVTADQSWANEVGRKLGISEVELHQHPYRHVLTVAVGATEVFRVNSYDVPIARATRVLLCTDGLHDVVTASEIEEMMLADQTAESKCRSLVAAARAAGGPDNITVVILDFVSKCGEPHEDCH